MSVTIIIPLFNPDKKSEELIKDILQNGYQDILLVNDGSDKDHALFFEKFEKYSQCTIIYHEKKRGKGRAVKTAFDFIVNNRTDITGVITVDEDQKYNIADSVRKCEKALIENPEKIILGARNFFGEKVSFKSKIGNKITNFAFWFCCGIKTKDSQTWLRAIPFKYLELFRLILGEGTEFGTNMLLEIKNQEIEYMEVPVGTYNSSADKSKNFSTLRDTLSVYAILFKYLLNSVMSEIIDLTMFSLIALVWASGLDDGIRLFLATAGARAVSSAFNFMFNRKAVFRSDEPLLSTAIRYYTLCVFQMLASYGLLYMVTEILNISGIFETVAKFFVDACLFVCCFQFQRIWVFKKKKSIVSK